MKQFSFLLFLFVNLSYGQNTFSSTSYGVSMGDLTTNFSDLDSLANAQLIYEYGKSYVEQHNYDLVFEYKNKTKIFTREGFDKANITIYLYESDRKKERIKNLKVSTYNLVNGKIEKTELDKKNIFEEQYNENYTLVKFAFPNVKEGSVLTYSYEIYSPFMYKFQPWTFQSDIPTLYSEYNTKVPANFEYNIKLVGTLELSTKTMDLEKKCLSGAYGASADCTVSQYVMTNIPPFKEEDYMTTKRNYLSRIEYELKTFKGFDGTINNYTKTWKTADRELKTDQNIGKQLGRSSIINDLLSEDITNEADHLSKAKKILEFVQRNYTWNDKFQLHNDVSVKNLVKERTGSAAEINILLHNLLEDNGINVKPVLLSTRENGLPAKLYPVISEFNYLIVLATINGKQYFLDATDKYLSFGELPYHCLNHYGRLLDFENGSEWIDIKPAAYSMVHTRTELSIDEDNNLKGVITRKLSGYHGLPLRKDYYGNPKSYIENLNAHYEDFEITDHKVLSDGPNDLDFVEEFQVESNQGFTEDQLYLNPFVIKYFTENPFKLKDRTYPIDFGYKDIYVYSCSIDLEDMYEVVELPKDISISLPKETGSCIYKVMEKDGKLMIYFKLVFDLDIYPSSYYEPLKKLMSIVVNSQKNSIVVLKKKQ